MKKKSKFIIKSNSSGRYAKIYLNGKWQRDIYRIEIYLEESGASKKRLHVKYDQCKRGKYGELYTVTDDNGELEIAHETKDCSF